MLCEAEGFDSVWATDSHGRARALDESIRLMRALWSEELVNFEGEFFCAYINHTSAAEILADLKKFAEEVVRSYA